MDMSVSVRFENEAIGLDDSGRSQFGDLPGIHVQPFGEHCVGLFAERWRRVLAAGDIHEVDGWVFHDLRRTARSLMSRAGVRPDVAEKVLGHTLQGVERVYDRHAYVEEKGEAVAKLAGLLGLILNPPQANVVHLKTS